MPKGTSKSGSNQLTNQPPAALIKPRDEVRDALDKRIGAGEKLMEKLQLIQLEEHLDDSKDEFRRWDDFNGELILRAFSNDSHSREYKVERGGSFQIGASLITRVGYLRNKYRDKISRLKSLHERLDIMHEAIPTSPDASTSKKKNTTGKVFVVHGHDHGLAAKVARTIQKLKLTPIILSEQENQGQTVIEKFEKNSDVDFAVVLLTPDDDGYPKGQPEKARSRARQNVILELGYFLHALGRNKVCALYAETVEFPSDLAGLLYVPQIRRNVVRFYSFRSLCEIFSHCRMGKRALVRLFSATILVSDLHFYRG